TFSVVTVCTPPMVPLTMTVSPSIPGSAPSWVSSSSPSPSKDLSWTMSGRSSTPYSCGSSAFLLASSSTMNIPASPLYTWSSVCPCGCGWYHSVAAAWSICQCGVHVCPGSIIWCGPPSISAGRCIPCQCTLVASGSALSTSTAISSPRSARSVGPRKSPSNPQVRVDPSWPANSLLASCALRSKVRTPSSTCESASGGTASSFVNSGSVTEVVETPHAARPAATNSETAATAAGLRSLIVPPADRAAPGCP